MRHSIYTVRIQVSAHTNKQEVKAEKKQKPLKNTSHARSIRSKKLEDEWTQRLGNTLVTP